MMRLYSTLLAIIFLTLPSLALAQAFGGAALPPALPAPLKPITPITPKASTPVAVSGIAFGKGNEILDGTLEIQHQMQILKRMIERETALNGMVQSALNIGIIDPFIPSPNENLCKQIPANILCAQSYPGIYGEYSADKIIAPILPPEPGSSSGIAMNDALVPKDISELEESKSLYWMDITCLGIKCSAIVSPEPTNTMARYRIRPGDKLPDGATVDKISAQGVTLKRRGETIHLDPAPAA